jgi:hypothetical protein
MVLSQIAQSGAEEGRLLSADVAKLLPILAVFIVAALQDFKLPNAGGMHSFGVMAVVDQASLNTEGKLARRKGRMSAV